MRSVYDTRRLNLDDPLADIRRHVRWAVSLAVLGLVIDMVFVLLALR